MTPLATPISDVQKVTCALTAPLTTPIPTPLPVNPFFRPVHTRGCYSNGERGTGNGERGAGNEHRERENEKLETKPNLKPSPISNFILFPVFILPFPLLVPRSSFPVPHSLFPVPRSPFPVPRFSNIHASQSLDRKNTTDFVFRSKRDLNVFYLVLKRL